MELTVCLFACAVTRGSALKQAPMQDYKLVVALDHQFLCYQSSTRLYHNISHNTYVVYFDLDELTDAELVSEGPYRKTFTSINPVVKALQTKMAEYCGVALDLRLADRLVKSGTKLSEVCRWLNEPSDGSFDTRGMFTLFSSSCRCVTCKEIKSQLVLGNSDRYKLEPAYSADDRGTFYVVDKTYKPGLYFKPLQSTIHT